ncbi:acetylglutamate kinase [Halobacillus sp. B29]
MTMSESTQATVRNDKPVIVIKLGGSMIERLTEEFYESFHGLLKHYHCLIVHGGGPAITTLLGRMDIEGEFHEGLRKTTKETLEVVEMVLGGKVNAQITSALARQNILPVGLKGCDASLLTASYVNQDDLGFVGQVEEVKTDLLYHCMQAGYLPVVAPLGKTESGQTVNINADLAAAAIAKAMQAEKLLFVTDVPGIISEDEVIKETSPEEIESLISGGCIYGGMIPKVQSAMAALSEHLQEVMIVSGEDALIQGDRMKGTKIRATVKERAE